MTGAVVGERLGVSLGENITLSALREPDKPCLIFPDGSHHTYAQTNARVNRLVAAVREHGIGRGDRLAVFALDSHRYVEIILAALKLGAVYVPLNYRLRRAEVDVLVARAEPVALFYDVRYEELLTGIAEEHPALRLTCALDARAGEASCEYEDLLAGGHEGEPPIVSGDRDVIGLAFTSGTTGLPKGVLQSQRMLKAIVHTQIVDFRMRHDDVRYTAAPLFHITGTCQILSNVALGASALLLPQFDAQVTLDTLAADALTTVFLVPTMISAILRLDGATEHDYERLRLISYGAAAMSPALLRRAMEVFGCDFLNAFGAGTEAGLQATLSPEEHRRAAAGRPELLGSIGKPAFGVALRIVDEDLREVPTGVVGEIATRSDMVFDGYLEMPQETAAATRGGWFRAGDMGYVDEHGYLYLHGRKKDMIVRGGENIYPVEIESVLAEHPDVVQSAVVGVEDEHWSEVVRAWVVLRAGSCATAEQLAEHCAQHLARYKVPAQFCFAEELPTNASGKILKRELRTW